MLSPEQRIAVRELDLELRLIVNKLRKLDLESKKDKPISIEYQIAELSIVFWRMRQIFDFPDEFSEKVGDFLTRTPNYTRSSDSLKIYIAQIMNLRGMLNDIINPIRFSES